MGKKGLTVMALAATALLIYLFPHIGKQNNPGAPDALRITRVWMVESDPALAAWIRKRAAIFEKESGNRVYVRSATHQEAQDAQKNTRDIVAPDLMIQNIAAGKAIAQLGYALILRDDQAILTTPAPTSALFSPPTMAPAPSFTPAPTPDLRGISPILGPEGLSLSQMQIQISQNPAADLNAKKAPAALLTAGQAAGLTCGYRAYPLPAQDGVVRMHALAFSSEGNQFLLFLQTEASQMALKNHGLYAVQAGLRLYGPEDPLRSMIEQSLIDP